MVIFNSYVTNYRRVSLLLPTEGTSTAMASPPRREDPCSSRRTMPLGRTGEAERRGVLDLGVKTAMSIKFWDIKSGSFF